MVVQAVRGVASDLLHVLGLCVRDTDGASVVAIAALEVRSFLAGKHGEFQQCYDDGVALVGLGAVGLGLLRQGRALMAMKRSAEAVTALQQALEHRAMLSHRNRALLVKWLAALGAPVDEAAGSAATAAVSNSRYPSTPHLPFSPQVNEDDIVMDARARTVFSGVPIVITEKLDGGNCCLCDGAVFARTHSHEATHASFGPIKSLCEEIYNNSDIVIEPGTRFFGENMFGIHSIEYDDLSSYFYLFGVQRPTGDFCSWDEVVAFADLLGVPTVPVV